MRPRTNLILTSIIVVTVVIVVIGLFQPYLVAIEKSNSQTRTERSDAQVETETLKTKNPVNICIFEEKNMGYGNNQYMIRGTIDRYIDKDELNDIVTNLSNDPKYVNYSRIVFNFFLKNKFNHGFYAFAEFIKGGDLNTNLYGFTKYEISKITPIANLYWDSLNTFGCKILGKWVDNSIEKSIITIYRCKNNTILNYLNDGNNLYLKIKNINGEKRYSYKNRDGFYVIVKDTLKYYGDGYNYILLPYGVLEKK